MTLWMTPEIAHDDSEVVTAVGMPKESEHPEYRGAGGAAGRGPEVTPCEPRGASAGGQAHPKGWEQAATRPWLASEVKSGGRSGIDAGEGPTATAVERIAGCLERLADGIDAIANHARLMSPPMTVEQVAGYARWKNRSTVYRWVREGRLRPLADKARPLLFDQAEVRRALGQVRGVGS